MYLLITLCTNHTNRSFAAWRDSLTTLSNNCFQCTWKQVPPVQREPWVLSSVPRPRPEPTTSRCPTSNVQTHQSAFTSVSRLATVLCHCHHQEIKFFLKNQVLFGNFSSHIYNSYLFVRAADYTYPSQGTRGLHPILHWHIGYNSELQLPHPNACPATILDLFQTGSR